MCDGFAMGGLGGCMTMAANKHMDLSQRIVIEKMLNYKESFKSIGRKLDKDCTTVSKEVRLRRVSVPEHTEEASMTACKGVIAHRLVYAANPAAQKRDAVYAGCVFSSVTSTNMSLALCYRSLLMFATDAKQDRNAHWKKPSTSPPPYSTRMRNPFRNRTAAS
jgi:hypothetical protein